MRLKYDHLAPARPVFFNSLQGDLDLRRMVTVVVDDRDVIDFAFHFQSALNPFDILQSRSYLVKTHIELHTHGNTGSGIVDIMHSGQIQIDRAHLLAVAINFKTAFALTELHVPDLKIRLGAHAVRGVAFFELGYQFLDGLVVQAQHRQAVKRYAIQKV